MSSHIHADQRNSRLVQPGLTSFARWPLLSWIAVIQLGMGMIASTTQAQLGSPMPDIKFRDSEERVLAPKKLLQQYKNVLVFSVQNEDSFPLLRRLFTMSLLSLGEFDMKGEFGYVFDGQKRILLPTSSVYSLDEGRLKMRLAYEFDGRGGRTSMINWVAGPQPPGGVILTYSDKQLAEKARQYLWSEVGKANAELGIAAQRRAEVQFLKRVMLVPDLNLTIARRFRFESLPKLDPGQSKYVPIACFIDQRGLIVCTASMLAIGK